MVGTLRQSRRILHTYYRLEGDEMTLYWVLDPKKRFHGFHRTQYTWDPLDKLESIYN